jgi:hypothetical protein
LFTNLTKEIEVWNAREVFRRLIVDYRPDKKSTIKSTISRLLQGGFFSNEGQKNQKNQKNRAIFGNIMYLLYTYLLNDTK